MGGWVKCTWICASGYFRSERPGLKDECRRTSKSQGFSSESDTINSSLNETVATRSASWGCDNEIMNKMNSRPGGGGSEPRVPTDLQKALAAASKPKAKWEGLTPIARRDFISWIDAAKQPETRKRRVEKACDMLVSGKRRPCCYAIVPMNLYKALNASPKAKVQWKNLTPNARRDFIGWIDSAKDPETHKLRIEKTCVMLTTGKQHP